jgi:hypothetical protein
LMSQGSESTTGSALADLPSVVSKINNMKRMGIHLILNSYAERILSRLFFELWEQEIRQK